MYSKNIKKLRNSWKRSDIKKKIFKKILLKTIVYDFSLSKNDLSEILITPHDPWPGDASIGEKILVGDFNFSTRKKLNI